jgi:hypothetical protein
MEWDSFVERHFQEWLDRTIPDDDRENVDRAIRDLVCANPDLLDRCSWPEMRRLTESK